MALEGVMLQQTLAKTPSQVVNVHPTDIQMKLQVYPSQTPFS